MKIAEVKIDPSFVKSLSNCFHLLQKVGKEIMFEFDAKAMILRAINDFKSSFCVVQLDSTLFDTFQTFRPSISFKLSVKPLCHLFKSLKSVKSLTLGVQQEGADHFLSFEFLFLNGILCRHRFFYQDCDIVNAIFDDDEGHYTSLSVRPKVLLSMLDHFHSRTPEIALTLSSNSFSMKSYYSPEVRLIHGSNRSHTAPTSKGVAASASNSSTSKLKTGSNLLINTGISLSLRELESYNYKLHHDEESNEETFVFATKEIEAFVAFCELNEFKDLELSCTTAGRPMKLSCQHDYLSACLIVATVESDRTLNDFAPKSPTHSSKKKSTELSKDAHSDHDAETSNNNNRKSILNPSLREVVEYIGNVRA